MGHDRQRSSKAVEVAGGDQRHERRVRCCSAVVERMQDDDPAVCSDRVGAKIGEVEVQHHQHPVLGDGGRQHDLVGLTSEVLVVDRVGVVAGPRQTCLRRGRGGSRRA